MSETATGPTVSYEHDGATWAIPADLLDLQRAWNRVHGEVETLVDGDDVTALKQARAHRLDLTDAITHHPWLLAAMAEGRRFPADLALKSAARR